MSFLVLDSLECHTRIDMSFFGTPYEFAWKMKHLLGIPFKILYSMKSNPDTHIQLNIIFKKRPRILYVVLKETG